MNIFQIINLLLVICAINFCYPNFVWAEKIAIEVSAIGEDNVGRKLVYQIKEQVRSSSSFNLTANDEPRLLLSIVTFAPFENRGIATLYSVVFTASGTGIGDIYLGQFIGICGEKAIRSSAESIIADADKYSEKFEKSKELGERFKNFNHGREVEQETLKGIVGYLNQQIETLKAELASEKAKTWWQKLTEKFETLYSVIINKVPQNKRTGQDEEEKKAGEKELQK